VLSEGLAGGYEELVARRGQADLLNAIVGQAREETLAEATDRHGIPGSAGVYAVRIYPRFL
jgi:hypothetical protein